MIHNRESLVMTACTASINQFSVSGDRLWTIVKRPKLLSAPTDLRKTKNAHDTIRFRPTKRSPTPNFSALPVHRVLKENPSAHRLFTIVPNRTAACSDSAETPTSRLSSSNCSLPSSLGNRIF